MPCSLGYTGKNANIAANAYGYGFMLNARRRTHSEY